MIFPHVQSRNAALNVARTMDTAGIHRLLSDMGVPGLPGTGALGELLPTDPAGFAAQFRIGPPGGGTAFGFSVLHGLSAQNQHVHAGLFGCAGREGPMLEAGALTVNYAFSMWNLRKIYFWTLDERVRPLAECPVPLHREGTLVEYVSDEGRLRDVNIFALYRQEWVADGLEFVEEITRGGAG